MKFFCIPSSLFACKSGLIDQLDFSQLRLEQVPKEIIKSRKHIEELLLNVNSIEELPPDLFRCTKIRRLDVSENKIKVIPPEIGILQSLEELNLSKNEIVEIPEEIGLCQNLAILDISTNIVTGFPKSFVNLAQLASLNLSNNSLTQLPQDIDRLSNLQFLDVAQCELRFLPPSIVRLERLKVLDLCDNYLTELPADMNGMASLEMLDLHCNMVGRLPEELLRCRSLKNLDLSGNQLNELPSNIGDLQMLVELVLCENQIRQLPNTIGQLKRLEVLKASKNCLTELTPSICSCAQLTDLILCENQLNELPASLGNLRRLRFLDVNVNNLHSIPSTIGGCQSLGILSLRHNQLSELPMEIGKLNHLQVLDVADNNLKYLPYTLTVLYQAKTLAALWLSFNQPPLPKLTTTHEPIMNIKVLTCYLLPQKDAQPMKRGTSKSCVGGARVCFVGDRREEEDEDKVPIGRFERYDTPHPKPFAPKNRHNRNSGDFSSAIIPNANNNIPSARSEKNNESSPPDPIPEPSRPLRSVLKRRPQSVLSQISTSDLMPVLLGGNEGNAGNGSRKLIKKNIEIRKGEAGFQWTIAGGAETLPHKGRSGLFISNLVPGGVAERAGFRLDDQLLAVNGNDMRGLGHQKAVELIRMAGDDLEVLIAREQDQQSREERQANRRSIPDFQIASMQCAAEEPPAIPERLTILVPRNGSGSVGFSVKGSGRWPEDPFTVSAITSTVECPLKLEDRIISVGGANLKFGARLDQVKTLLAGMPGTRVEIVVERGGQWPPPPIRILPSQYGHGPSICGTAFSELTLSRSLPSLLAPLPGTTQNEIPSNSTGTAAVSKSIQKDGSSSSATANSAPPPPRHFQRQFSNSVRPNAKSSNGPPQPPPRHHRSMSSLIGIGLENGGITAEMLRASTPIEYPPGEEPTGMTKMKNGTEEMQKIKEMNTKMDERKHQQQHQPAVKKSPSSSPPTRPTILHHHSRLPQPTSSATTTFSAESNGNRNSPPTASFSSPPLRKSPSNSPPSMSFRMDIVGRMEPPLAASSPIPSQLLDKDKQHTKSSHIPILMNISSPTNGKTPPPVAPKPKVTSTSSNGFDGPKLMQIPSPFSSSTNTEYVNTNHAAEQPKQQKAIVEQQSSNPSSSPSSTFSSKLKLFEQMQTTTNNGNGMAANGMGIGGGGKEGADGSPINSLKPSGIPLKKPLVSAQDLEKLREEERRLKEWNNMDEVDEDEHRDTVRELSRLLGEQNGGGSAGFSSPIGPSVIRTKKAEIRAERAASAMENNMNNSSNGSGMEDGGSLSRASSSLSQKAAEIEKRREWRQARLQSMDVESKRTDDLVKLIASATAATAATQQQQTASNNPSPIPIGP